MKKAPFDRRFGEEIDSLSLAQSRDFVKDERQKRRNRIDLADMGRSVLRPYNIVVFGYSRRRALMGWMLAARFAGMIAARNEQIARATAAMVRAVGSQDETP
jgi:hypothetical protein